MASRIATTMPRLDAASARWGTPLRLSRPSGAGAKRPLARENNIRVERYKLVFALERAAVITTRFMIRAAYGTPIAAKARTKGLPVIVPSPVWFQGVMVTITAIART